MKLTKEQLDWLKKNDFEINSEGGWASKELSVSTMYIDIPENRPVSLFVSDAVDYICIDKYFFKLCRSDLKLFKKLRKEWAPIKWAKYGEKLIDYNSEGEF